MAQSTTFTFFKLPRDSVNGPTSTVFPVSLRIKTLDPTTIDAACESSSVRLDVARGSDFRETFDTTWVPVGPLHSCFDLILPNMAWSLPGLLELACRSMEGLEGRGGFLLSATADTTCWISSASSLSCLLSSSV